MAYENIAAFHRAQMEEKPVEVETMPGVKCKRVPRPIGMQGPNVGLARVYPHPAWPNCLGLHPSCRPSLDLS